MMDQNHNIDIYLRAGPKTFGENFTNMLYPDK